MANVCLSDGANTTNADDGSMSADASMSGDASSTADGSATSSADAGDSSADDTTSGGCQGSDGTIECPCLAGNACLGDLTCDSQRNCVCLSGTPCGQSDCVVDFETDNRHCGSCGNACVTHHNETVGYCAQAQCTPTLSNCVPSAMATTCDSICQAEGRTCVEQGCGSNDRTWFSYGGADVCQSAEDLGSTGSEPCSTDLSTVLFQDYVRCCCTP